MIRRRRGCGAVLRAATRSGGSHPCTSIPTHKILQIIMGIIVDKQPQFVHGIHDAAKSAKACYGGGA